jgi:hypothetical protein
MGFLPPHLVSSLPFSLAHTFTHFSSGVNLRHFAEELKKLGKNA